MKKLKLVLTGFVLLFACEKEDKAPDRGLITGTWRLEQVIFNETDGVEINDWISNSTILNIDANGFYYRNYVGGEWIINNRTLILDPGETMPEFYWEYEVLALSKETLKVRISLTEGQYCCDFDQFEENDVLSITETYIRSE